MRLASHSFATESWRLAPLSLNACREICSMEAGLAPSATASTSVRARVGHCRTSFMRRSCCQLLEDVLHRLPALLPGRHLHLDAQLVLPGQSGALALLDEGDDLLPVDRRVFHELQLQRLMGGVDARHAERARGDAYLVA